MMDSVQVGVDAGVMTLRMNRADKKNALTRAMYSRMAEALREALVTRDRKTVYRVDDGIPVLLVEDEPEVRKVLRMQLTGLGYAVIEAADGVEALGLLQNIDDIALLVSDTVMPGGIGGRDLARHARALRPELPILLVTGYASDSTLLDDMPGDIPTLRKPFDQQALAAVLSALLSPKPATEAEPQCP